MILNTKGDYATFRLREYPIKPTSAVPNSQTAAGTGTGLGVYVTVMEAEGKRPDDDQSAPSSPAPRVAPKLNMLAVTISPNAAELKSTVNSVIGVPAVPT